jgi:four helix bundle protein
VKSSNKNKKKFKLENNWKTCNLAYHVNRKIIIMKTHKDLIVWQKSIDFVTEIYRVTKSYPKDELYGLTIQLRRASVSIPSNIAEGAARSTKKEFNQFLHFSLGSLSEIETQLIISQNLGFINSEDFSVNLTKLVHIRKILLGLIASLDR